jgi:hypothetical protein
MSSRQLGRTHRLVNAIYPAKQVARHAERLASSGVGYCLVTNGVRLGRRSDRGALGARQLRFGSRRSASRPSFPSTREQRFRHQYRSQARADRARPPANRVVARLSALRRSHAPVRAAVSTRTRAAKARRSRLASIADAPGDPIAGAFTYPVGDIDAHEARAGGRALRPIPICNGAVSGRCASTTASTWRTAAAAPGARRAAAGRASERNALTKVRKK